MQQKKGKAQLRRRHMWRGYTEALSAPSSHGAVVVAVVVAEAHVAARSNQEPRGAGCDTRHAAHLAKRGEGPVSAWLVVALRGCDAAAQALKRRCVGRRSETSLRRPRTAAKNKMTTSLESSPSSASPAKSVRFAEEQTKAPVLPAFPHTSSESTTSSGSSSNAGTHSAQFWGMVNKEEEQLLNVRQRTAALPGALPRPAWEAEAAEKREAARAADLAYAELVAEEQEIRRWERAAQRQLKKDGRL
ncbi:hypothetical protein EDC01DRAFT_786107 [Geopyxis carbonaria]|nr:hypothetical protein EDC01DRAFT_786107 [Geopyxis carbonaria]